MGNTDVSGKIKKAESEIGQILKHLEQETNQLVEDLELCCFEDGGHDDDRPTYLRHVLIKMRCMPGTNWA
jgi:hypothetical protein